MGWQLITMGFRMGGMSWRKGRFRDFLVLPVRQWIFYEMMAGIFQVTFTILARPGFHGDFFRIVPFWRRESWGHTQ
jgi:hypothetical protein